MRDLQVKNPSMSVNENPIQDSSTLTPMFELVESCCVTDMQASATLGGGARQSVASSACFHPPYHTSPDKIS